MIVVAMKIGSVIDGGSSVVAYRPYGLITMERLELTVYFLI